MEQTSKITDVFESIPANVHHRIITQFDPDIANVMQQLIDADPEYKMKEKNTVDELAGKNELYCGEYGNNISDGIVITRNITRLHLKYTPEQTDSASGQYASMILFDSLDDGKTTGPNYREYGLVRLDGEYWETDDKGKNDLIVTRQESFKGWDNWREVNKQGFDASVSVNRKDNEVTLITENQGIYIKNTTFILDGTSDIYIALTGDQCALTNIRIGWVFL